MGKLIVIVEDDASILDILRLILTRAGYEVDHFQDGNHFVAGAAPLADLYLIDRQLSGIDGLDICRFLKSKPESQSIPIIVLSATPGIQNLVQQAGADDFIEKPFSKKHLLAKIQQLLQ